MKEKTTVVEQPGWKMVRHFLDADKASIYCASLNASLKDKLGYPKYFGTYSWPEFAAATGAES